MTVDLSKTKITGSYLRQVTKEEFDRLVKLAIEDDVMPKYNLGILYLYGQQTNVDFKEAAKWFGKAAEKGDRQSGLFLGYMAENALGSKVNYSSTLHTYEKYVIDPKNYEALRTKAEKTEDAQVAKVLKDLFKQLSKLKDDILDIKGLFHFDEQSGFYSFNWDSVALVQIKKLLTQYNDVANQFKVYIDVFFSSTSEQNIGKWAYYYFDCVRRFQLFFNALYGRYTFRTSMERDGMVLFDENSYLNKAIGFNLDHKDVLGITLIAEHDDNADWMNALGLWYEYNSMWQDTREAEKWYNRAIKFGNKEAEMHLSRLQSNKLYRLAKECNADNADECYSVAQSFTNNKERANDWFLMAASAGNEHALRIITQTDEVKNGHVLDSTSGQVPYWKEYAAEKKNMNSNSNLWVKAMVKAVKDYQAALQRAAEEAERKRREAEEAKRRAAEEAERRRLAAIEAERQRKIREEQEKRRAAEEAERRRLAAIEAERQRKIQEENNRRQAAINAAQAAEAERQRLFNQYLANVKADRQEAMWHSYIKKLIIIIVICLALIVGAVIYLLSNADAQQFLQNNFGISISNILEQIGI